MIQPQYNKCSRVYDGAAFQFFAAFRPFPLQSHGLQASDCKGIQTNIYQNFKFKANIFWKLLIERSNKNNDFRLAQGRSPDFLRTVLLRPVIPQVRSVVVRFSLYKLIFCAPRTGKVGKYLLV